jgi:hypothetical protein
MLIAVAEVARSSSRLPPHPLADSLPGTDRRRQSTSQAVGLRRPAVVGA